jgi:hypothetical protein
MHGLADMNMDPAVSRLFPNQRSLPSIYIYVVIIGLGSVLLKGERGMAVTKLLGIPAGCWGTQIWPPRRLLGRLEVWLT